MIFQAKYQNDINILFFVHILHTKNIYYLQFTHINITNDYLSEIISLCEYSVKVVLVNHLTLSQYR